MTSIGAVPHNAKAAVAGTMGVAQAALAQERVSLIARERQCARHRAAPRAHPKPAEAATAAAAPAPAPGSHTVL